MGLVAINESASTKDASAEEEVWTVGRMLNWMQGYLERKGDENPRLSAQWLLSDATGLSRVQLYVNLDRQLSANELAVLRSTVSRRGVGEPLQYITGQAAFRHITVKVAPGVLIPRPETEVLVSEALSLLPPAKRPRSFDDRFIEALAQGVAANGTLDDDLEEASDADDAYADVKRVLRAAREEVAAPQGDDTLLVADIGTGSGCVACSMAYEHSSVRVIAADISAEALALARENVAALGLEDRITLVKSDIGDGIDPVYEGRFDLVVSNPPYIPREVLATLSPEVSQFEPQLALDGGEDGLDVYRRLLDWCTRALKPGGKFAVELHETCLDSARELACDAGFENVRVVNDLAGKPRVLTAVKSPSV